jgi:propanol-preferring alcohol dehydrogenase
MRALQLVEWQKSAELREVPEPGVRPGQVLVRVGGAGACHSDLHLMHDFPPGQLPWGTPFTLGHENAGWVEAIGAGVTKVEAGQPVLVYGPRGCGTCLRCRAGIENYCEQPDPTAAAVGLGADGGMARFMLVPDERHLVPLRSLDPVQAAPLADAGLTPYHALKRSLPLLGAGSSIVVIGVGGLGQLGVQFARVLTAAEVIAVDTRSSALEVAEASGAHHTVLSGPDVATEVLAATRGRGVEVVLDFVGSDDTLALGAALVRSLGHLTLVGIAGGALPFSFFSTAYEVSLATTYWGSIPELMEVVELAERGRIHIDVEEFTLDDALVAYERMRAGQLRGRAVVVP